MGNQVPLYPLKYITYYVHAYAMESLQYFLIQNYYTFGIVTKIWYLLINQNWGLKKWQKIQVFL